jgi:hypothetical protein
VADQAAEAQKTAEAAAKEAMSARDAAMKAIEEAKQAQIAAKEAEKVAVTVAKEESARSSANQTPLVINMPSGRRSYKVARGEDGMIAGLSAEEDAE